MSIKLKDKVYRNTQEQVLKNAEDIEELKAGTILIPDGAVTAPKIAGNAVTTDKLALNAVSTEKIQDEAVTTAKIKDSAVTTDKIANGAVATGKIADNAVTTDKIDDDSITTGKIVNDAVSYQKLDVDLKKEVNFGISERLKTLNLWDEQYRFGNFGNYGEFQTIEHRICSLNKIHVIPGENYTNSSPYSFFVYYYDSTGTFIGEDPTWPSGTSHTIPSNCYFINFSTTTNQVTYDNNIMINEGSTALPYQPYNGHIIHKIDIEPVLLWENANPTVSFSSTTITMNNSSQFKYLVIKVTYFKSGCIPQYYKIDNTTGNSFINIANLLSDESASRAISISSSTTATIGNAYVNNSSGQDNEFIIPLAIYGTNVL